MKIVLHIKSLFYYSCIIALFSCVQLHAQKRQYFKPADLMQAGTYYYPEQWPKAQWERDLKNIHDLGFEFTHYAEFAWALMEPEEGKFNFGWLDTAIDIAAKHGLKVILCTPTPTPPVWLTEKYPDIRVEKEDGTVVQHGSRQQASWANETYRRYCTTIVERLAKRYGNNKNVWGWQIDNEPSHQGEYDYSPAAVNNFRKWLEKKYITIDSLNKIWGTAFWSIRYNNFSQIPIPNQRSAGRVNPHAMLDFKRYTADEAASFIHMQYDLLRKHITKDQWITTNVMPEYGPVDPRRMNKLDIMTYTKYLVPAYGLTDGEQGFRMGSNISIPFSTDFVRSVTGEVAVMELQPGQVNWGKYNPQTYPGAVRMWTYHVFAGGNKFVCNYRYRQPLYGIEQYHYGVMQTDGVTLSHSGAEYVQAINEIKQLRKLYDPALAIPKSYAARRTAILYNVDNRWETEYQPQTTQWDVVNHLRKYYKAARSFTAPVDFIKDSTDFNQYPVMIAPAYQLTDTTMVARWKTYAAQGGHLVLTCRTAQKDRNAWFWEAPFAGPIHSLIGAKELFYDHLQETQYGNITFNGNTYRWNNWADVITPDGGEVWATYNDQFYKGKAAVITQRTGKGTITYIGADTDDGKLEKAVLQKVYEHAGIALQPLPDGVALEWRDGFWIGMNYNSTEQTVPVPSNATIITGAANLPPAGVVVWKEKQ
jgi:beta-galactosidase